MIQVITAFDAKEVLINYGISVLNDNISAGLGLTDVFHEVLNVAYGPELDQIIETNLHLNRTWGMDWSGFTIVETDEEYRNRAKMYSIEYDPMIGSFVARSISTSKACTHSWKSYTGFTEVYEYCSKCDEKKR